MTYRTEAEEAEARGADEHERERAGHHSASRTRAWVDPVTERDLYLEALGETIIGLRYDLDPRTLEAKRRELAEKEAEYERVQQWRPAPEPDARCFPSMGTDERECWRDREPIRVVVP